MLTSLNEVKRTGRSPEEPLTREISILGKLREVWESFGRCGSSGNWIRRSGRSLGVPGAGFVVPGEAWEGQILTDLSQSEPT